MTTGYYSIYPCCLSAHEFTPRICLFLLLDFNVPEMDIAFAISTTAFQSDLAFEKMKDTVNEFVNRFGVLGRVHYSVLTFGDSPTVHLQFNNKSTTKSSLMQVVGNIPKPSKGAALGKALVAAKMVFNPASGGRPQANKILVVMIDRESDSSEEDARKAAKDLQQDGIRIIAVALGDEHNLDEVEMIVPIKEDVFKSNKSDDAKDIADSLVKNMLDGE